MTDNATPAPKTTDSASKADQNTTLPAVDSKKTTTPTKEKDTSVPPRSSHRNTKRRSNGFKKEAKEFEESILQIDRVTRVVKGGRRMRFRIAVVIGDRKGRVGMGIGKSGEVLGGIQKAVAAAKKSLVNVKIYNGTLPHNITAKFKTSKVLLFSAPAGKGIIAGSSVRKILELGGYKDVLSKIHGSRNKINVAKATFLALSELQTREEPIKKVENKSSDTKKQTSDTKKSPEKTPDKKLSDKKPPAKPSDKKSNIKQKQSPLSSKIKK